MAIIQKNLSAPPVKNRRILLEQSFIAWWQLAHLDEEKEFSSTLLPTMSPYLEQTAVLTNSYTEECGGWAALWLGQVHTEFYVPNLCHNTNYYYYYSYYYHYTHLTASFPGQPG